MRFLIFLLALLSTEVMHGQASPEMRYADKIRIREAIKISSTYGDKLFKGFNKAPFAIILVTDSIEYLINHPNPSSDFVLSGYDETLHAKIYYRRSQFSPKFLATFPAVNGLSCIVVGTPENTDKNSTEWIVTLLHEHFHQYQSADPTYYESINSLDLSGGDQTGIWMLNYDFPYDSSSVKSSYEQYTNALLKTVSSIDTRDYQLNLSAYLRERKKFTLQLKPADYRYLSLQIWQEGLARYTEYNFLELLENYKSSKELLSLPDFVAFKELKSKMYQQELKNLQDTKLNEERRVSFYSLGFAEGLLLDRQNKNWRTKYMSDKFFIEKYFTNLSRSIR